MRDSFVFHSVNRSCVYFMGDYNGAMVLSTLIDWASKDRSQFQASDLVDELWIDLDFVYPHLLTLIGKKILKKEGEMYSFDIDKCAEQMIEQDKALTEYRNEEMTGVRSNDGGDAQYWDKKEGAS